MVNFFRILDSERHIAFCPANFVADIYIGCPHACWYCYAPSFSRPAKFEKSFENFRLFKPRLKERHIEKIGEAIKTANPKGLCDPRKERIIEGALKRRFPVRLGSVSEPLGMPLEKEYRHCYKVMEKFIENDYPFLVCTKSPLIAAPEYIDLLKSAKFVAAQISLISADDKLLRFIETRPGGATPSASSRLDAMKKLVNNGIWTTCRIQPMIPRVTEMGMKELIFKLAEIGVNHVIVEFMKFPLMHAKGMSLKLKQQLNKYCEEGGELPEDLRRFNNDLYRFYKSFPDSVVIGNYLFFSRREKARLMKQFAQMVKDANKEYGTKMTFASGDEETQFLNFTWNCCGIDQLEGFEGFSTCTIQTMLKIIREKGKVTLKDMKNYYNPCMERFFQLWRKKVRGMYYFEERVFGLKAIEENGEIAYTFDENLIPG